MGTHSLVGLLVLAFFDGDLNILSSVGISQDGLLECSHNNVADIPLNDRYKKTR